MFRQPELRGCESKTYGEAGYLGAMSDIEVNSFSYWIPIRQTDTGQVCIAEMLIAI